MAKIKGNRKGQKMAWDIKDKWKVINQVLELFEEFSSNDSVIAFQILGEISSQNLNIENKKGVDEAFDDIIENILYFFENIENPKISRLFKLKLMQIDTRLDEYTTEIDEPNGEFISVYWKNIKPLQKAINRNDKFTLTKNLKNQILTKMLESINGENYLISILLIYGHIDDDIFINFLFHNAVNTKAMFDLLINSTDKYYQKLMFNVAPSQLPNFDKYFDINEVEQIRRQINIVKLMNRVNTVTLKELKELFPKSYKYSIMTNPFVEKDRI